MLVTVGGLPATGKTTICREAASQFGAVHLRVDTIEQAVVDSTELSHPVGHVGYVTAYALAKDFLDQGHVVLAESVNPLDETRDAWRHVAAAANVALVEVEVVCHDRAEHRRRAETRVADIPGLRLPTWDEIQARDYRPWIREHLVLDTAANSPAACIKHLKLAVSAARSPG